jgi:GNAT superfamily N-acetyltransferase
VVDFLNAVDVVDLGRPDTSAEDVESDWGQEGFDLWRDAWVAVDAGGEIVGYAYVGDQFRTGEIEADVQVLPSDEAAGSTVAPATAGETAVGTARRLLDLVERRASQLAAERGYERPRLDLFAVASNRAKRRLLEEGGYEVRRRVLRMAVGLSDAPPPLAAPPGVDLRAFRLGRDEHTMRAVMDEAFEDHFRQSEEPFEAWRARLLDHADFDPDLWFIAWEGQTPVAGIIAYDHGDLGWVKGLGTLRSWRGRGVGSALLSLVFAELRRRGQNRVELGVDADAETGALSVYERAGMHVALEYLLYERELET